jgi:hypothetical protein
VKTPSASHVAERAVVSALLRARSDLERQFERDERRARSAQEEIAAFVELVRLAPSLESYDKWLLATPPGTLEFSHKQDADWSIGVAALLAWALGLAQKLPFDGLVAVDEVSSALGLLRPEVSRAVIVNARLRSSADLSSGARETILIRHGIIKRNVSSMPDAVYAGVVNRALSGFGLAPATDVEVRTTLARLTQEMLDSSTAKLYATRLSAFEWLLGARATFWQEQPDMTDRMRNLLARN